MAAAGAELREESGVAGSDRSGLDHGLERRLVVLMAARLALALLSLGIALVLDHLDENRSLAAAGGIYATIAFAFVATIVYGAALPWVRRPRSYAAIHLATDIAIVSALVHFSGGRDSVFTFLYVLVAVYGAVLFERRGALVAAGLAAVTYGAVLVAGRLGWGGVEATEPPTPGAVLLMVWVVHAGAVLLVAGLASFLSAELRRTGEALQERTSDLWRLQSLYQRTVQSIMSGLLTIDCDGAITSFNPEAERITGLPVDEALGLDVEAVIPGVRVLVIDSAAEESGLPSRARTPYRNRREESLHLGVAAYPLRDEEGASNGHVMIFQDVTRVVEMERDLRRSERLAAVGQLSASLAHEIRNPLAAISGSIQMLRSQRLDSSRGDESRRLMEIVLREIDRLDHLISDFLHYARPVPPRLEPVCVAHAVGEVAEMFEGSRPESVRLSLEVPPEVSVRADPDQLRQLMWNLVLNASQAMPDGGALTIRAGAEPPRQPQEGATDRRNDAKGGSGWAEISVADQGEGIPTNVLERIFDPFFTTKRGGTGLGLATVHRIVEAHGGTVRIESMVGCGTTVRVRLPRVEGPA